MVPWSGVTIKELIFSVALCTGGKINNVIDTQFNKLLQIFVESLPPLRTDQKI